MTDALHLDFEKRLTLVEQELRVGAARFERLEKSHELNTRVTLDTRLEVGKLGDAITAQQSSIQALTDKVSEPLSIYDNAMIGLRMIGRFGSACLWLGRRWWLVLAVVVAVKVMWTGGSWAEAWAAIVRTLTAGPGH